MKEDEVIRSSENVRGAAEATDVKIRSAVVSDVEAIARLLDVLGYPTAALDLPARLAALDGRDHAVFVAIEPPGGTVVGLLSVHSHAVLHAPRHVAQITALATAPEARGRGVGRRLVAAAEQWARDHGCIRLHVTSAERRSDAHAFYPACGLPYTGRRFTKSLE